MREMNFYFVAEGDRLKLIELKEEAVTGNVNTYFCRFDLNDDWQEFKKIAVFKNDEASVGAVLEEGDFCKIPADVLKNSGEFSVGLYGTKEGENFKRIATNFTQVKVSEGAYREDITTPEIPQPDLWERLLSKNLPVIGENGNWYLWDIEREEYKDSGRPSMGQADLSGYAEKSELSEVAWNAGSAKEISINAENTANAAADMGIVNSNDIKRLRENIGEVEAAIDEIITLQNQKIGGDGA